MAKYTTVSHMLLIMPSVRSSTNATSAELAYFIYGAEGRVDAYLSKRYALPLASIPVMIETISTNIAVYDFLSKRVFAGQIAAESFWVAAFKESMKDLENIANGKVELVTSSGESIGTNRFLFWSSNENYLPTFTEDDVLNQKIDEDKLDDIAQDRGYLY
jgi:phage gp36-like protein